MVEVRAAMRDELHGVLSPPTIPATEAQPRRAEISDDVAMRLTVLASLARS